MAGGWGFPERKSASASSPSRPVWAGSRRAAWRLFLGSFVGREKGAAKSGSCEEREGGRAGGNEHKGGFGSAQFCLLWKSRRLRRTRKRPKQVPPAPIRPRRLLHRMSEEREAERWRCRRHRSRGAGEPPREEGEGGRELALGRSRLPGRPASDAREAASATLLRLGEALPGQFFRRPGRRARGRPGVPLPWAQTRAQPQGGEGGRRGEEQPRQVPAGRLELFMGGVLYSLAQIGTAAQCYPSGPRSSPLPPSLSPHPPLRLFSLVRPASAITRIAFPLSFYLRPVFWKLVRGGVGGSWKQSLLYQQKRGGSECILPGSSKRQPHGFVSVFLKPALGSNYAAAPTSAARKITALDSDGAIALENGGFSLQGCAVVAFFKWMLLLLK